MQVRCSADHVQRGKPAPDVYLRAAEKLNLPPSDCLALEDSPTGARAAVAAGMVCYAVPDPSHTHVNAFEGITPYVFDNLHAAIDNRAGLITRTDGLAVNNIPEGGTLKSQLRAVFTASHAADIAYLNWVQAAGSGCPTTSGSAYQAVVAANSDAQAAKLAFLATWNPVAQRYGLPQRSNTQI